MEPKLESASELEPILEELLQREPIFHRPEFGTSRAEFEEMMAPEFWEVGASGRRYSREVVLDTLESRGSTPGEERWTKEDAHCQRLSPDTYLLTYTLKQGTRITRRATIWRDCAGAWKIVYHQGTIVSAPDHQ